MKWPWREGNQVELLENGESFFPRVFEAIDGAREEVLIETFILFDDKVGRALREKLIAASARGVRVEISVDGYGSPDLDGEFSAGLALAGVQLRYFGPARRVFGKRANVFRRMHRKLAVIDGEIAFVGGINFGADHLADFGPTAKQDYAVALRGPIVDDIRHFMLAVIDGSAGSPPPLPAAILPRSQPCGDAIVRFVQRDNHRCRTDIEQMYRMGIRNARREIMIANAYFFPGYRLLRDLRNAARRGVKVTLVMQGEPDMPLAMKAARWLYRYLMRAGVVVYEYCERPLHGKVALVDDDWSTVGSSNLDPLSLSLNLEANVVIRDRAFNATLRERMQVLIREHCERIDESRLPPRTLWAVLRGVFVFHVLRRFPAWAGLLPGHAQKLKPAKIPAEVAQIDGVSAPSGGTDDTPVDDPPGVGAKSARPPHDRATRSA